MLPTSQIVKLVSDVFYPGMLYIPHPISEQDEDGKTRFKAAARSIWGTEDSVILIDIKEDGDQCNKCFHNDYARYVLDKLLDNDIGREELSVIASSSAEMHGHALHIEATRFGETNTISTRIKTLSIGKCYPVSPVVILNTYNLHHYSCTRVQDAVQASRYGLIIIADCDKLFASPLFAKTDFGKVLAHCKTAGNAHVVNVKRDNLPADFIDQSEAMNSHCITTLKANWNLVLAKCSGKVDKSQMT